MTLILLAISLTIALCVIAYNFAIYALPFMVGLTAFQYVYGMEAGFLLSALAALGAALLSVALVIAVVGFAKNPALGLIALAVFAVPAMIAGYALVHGVTKNFVELDDYAEPARRRRRSLHRHSGDAQSQCARYRRPVSLMRSRIAARHKKNLRRFALLGFRHPALRNGATGAVRARVFAPIGPAVEVGHRPVLSAVARSPLSASFPSVSWRPRTPSCSPALQFTRSHLRPTGWNNAIHPRAQ